MKIWNLPITEEKAVNMFTTKLVEERFNHFKFNNKYNFVDPDSGVQTQKFERVWGSSKLHNKKHRGTSQIR